MSIRNDIQGRTVQVAFPQDLAAPMMPLLVAERAEMEAVFGAPVTFVEHAPATGPRWVVDVAPCAIATLRWDAATATMISTVGDAAGLMSTLNMLHSLATLGVSERRDDGSEDLTAATARLARELANGFPGYDIRGISPEQILTSRDADRTWQNVARAIARLQDAHTALRATVPVYNPPYAVRLAADRAVMLRVPAWSAAWEAGVRAGWQVQIDDAAGWLQATGAPLHAHALIAGRRAMALNGIEERAFVAIAPRGERQCWTERARVPWLDDLLECVVAGNDVYVRLLNWIAGVGIEDRLAPIVAGGQVGQRLILDLRGNTGGNLVMAQQMRRLFLRERTLLGTIRFTRGDGTLADPVELWDEPPPQGAWPGELIALTDALTYSASEDFLHGLQGLPHVTVIGAPSGGGSGRPRTIPFTPGWSVSISTALTYDRSGRCIEGQGIPVDIAADPFAHTWQELVALVRT